MFRSWICRLAARRATTPPRGFRPSLTALETRAVPAAFTLSADSIAVAPEDGGIPRVKIIDPKTGADIGEVDVYDVGFRGGVRAATGDVTGDGVKDLVTAAGPGGGPHIKVYDGKTGTEIRSFFAYVPEFRNGLSVAVGDVNRDGFADIITAAGPGGGPNVRVFDGRTGTLLTSFFAYDSGFTGGLNVGSGDIDGDGYDDIVTGVGSGGGPHVRVLSGRDFSELRSFYAYAPTVTGGVNVASGDVDGDGRDDLVIGAGKNAGPHVRVLSGRDGSELRSFFADDSSFTGGVRVSSFDVNGDGLDDILPRTRHGGDVAQFVFDSRSGTQTQSFIRKVDDNPSASDLIEGSGRNSGSNSNSGSGATGGGGTTTGVTKVEGTIAAVNVSARIVTLRFGNGTTRVVTVAAGAKVERNGLDATLASFLVGDFGQARLDASGAAFKVEAVG